MDIKIIENQWIVMSDGCRLSAKIWFPSEAATTKLPSVLEYIPYRKRGGTEMHDDLMFPFLAKNGYVGIRVDIRGNGEADGLMEDEYTQTELNDGLEVIDWISRQKWSTGKVGMIGHSWGAINAIQLAALQPLALKAIICSCGTDDRYLDDIHTMHGSTVTDQLTWSQQMFAYSSRPPDPELVGKDWKKIWKCRLENMPFLAKNWFSHPHKDEFWKHGSVREDYSKIKAAVLTIGGWYDIYSNAILRLMEGLESPCRGIIGPWEHKYPHLVHNSPNIDFFAEMLRWFDYWLKDIDNGVDKLPKVQAYLMENAPASQKYSHRKGYWIGEKTWPPQHQQFLSYYLGENSLQTNASSKLLQFTVSTLQNTGAMTGNLCPGMRIDDELPGNQIMDDEKSVIFDSAILTDDIVIFGTPILELSFSSDSQNAFIAVRLCEVNSQGESVRVTYQVYNLCHRDSYEFPVALEPHKEYQVKIPLCDAGYTFKKGNKIRLSVSNTYWPLIFPSPSKVILKISSIGTKLILPIRKANEAKIQVSLAPSNSFSNYDFLRKPSNQKSISNSKNGYQMIVLDDDMGRVLNKESNLILDSKAKHSYHIHPDNPLSALVEASWEIIMKRDSWEIKTETISRAKVDAKNFYLYSEITAYDGEECFFHEKKEEVIKRNLT